MIQYFLPIMLAFSFLEAKIIETKHVEDVLPLIDAETWFLVDLDNCMFKRVSTNHDQVALLLVFSYKFVKIFRNIN